MTTPLQALLRALALDDASLHIRSVPRNVCHRDGQVWPCDVQVAADAVRQELEPR